MTAAHRTGSNRASMQWCQQQLHWECTVEVVLMTLALVIAFKSYCQLSKMVLALWCSRVETASAQGVMTATATANWQ